MFVAYTISSKGREFYIQSHCCSLVFVAWNTVNHVGLVDHFVGHWIDTNRIQEFHQGWECGGATFQKFQSGFCRNLIFGRDGARGNHQTMTPSGTLPSPVVGYVSFCRGTIVGPTKCVFTKVVSWYNGLPVSSGVSRAFSRTNPQIFPKGAMAPIYRKCRAVHMYPGDARGMAQCPLCERQCLFLIARRGNSLTKTQHFRRFSRSLFSFLSQYFRVI